MTTEKLSPIQQELLSRADSIFDSIAKAANSTIDFAKEQLPDIALQYVTFYRVYYTLIVAVALIGIVVGLYSWFRVAIFDSFKTQNENYSTWSDFRTFTCTIGILMIVSSSVTLLLITKDALLVWFAPKIFIIQSITDLIKASH